MLAAPSPEFNYPEPVNFSVFNQVCFVQVGLLQSVFKMLLQIKNLVDEDCFQDMEISYK